MYNRTRCLTTRIEKEHTSLYQKFRKGYVLPKSGPFGGYNINPNRYVWHVSKSANRIGIHQQGLLAQQCKYGSYGPAVFANNMNTPTFGIYQCLYNDFFEIEILERHSTNKEQTVYICQDVQTTAALQPTFEEYAAYYGLDFWRIDTHKISTNWWLDLRYEYDYAARSGREYYIYTTTSIPRDAIQLFRYKGWDSFHYTFNKDLGVANARFIPRMYEIRHFK